MKKLFALILLTVTIVVMAAGKYQIPFNEYLDEGKYQEADSILREWNRATPNDPELFSARSIMYLHRAFGNDSLQDAFVDSAFTVIDRGIAALPDRIDFRIGKATTASMIGRWATAIDAIDGLLDRDAENGGHWFEAGNTVKSNADSIIADVVFKLFIDIFDSNSRDVIKSALPTAAKAAKRFDSDLKILNMAGSFNLGIGNNDTALIYFEEASRIAPDDLMTLSNIGYVKYLQGDSVKALEVYRQIANGDYDKESQDAARQMVEKITTPAKNMREYDYFFYYLPQIASQITNSDDFLDVEMINSRILAANKWRSPFENNDIKIDEFSLSDSEPKVVVWTFPMPKEIPMCRYVAFVPHDNGRYKILTLEKSLDCWVVGSKKDTTHSNYGSIPYPVDAAAFVKALSQKKLLER